MGMTQLVVGAALGCIAAQGGIYGIRQLAGWLQRDGVGARLRSWTPSAEPALIAAFIKYAGPVGAGVAVITLGVWAVGDYVSAKSVRGATLANVADSPAPLPAPDTQDHGSAEATPAATPAKSEPPAAVAAANKVDPYVDADFRVQRKPYRAGTALSLKETLLRRSETKARTDLLKEIQQHLSRSQYDCEAADRAAKYLKADLDVWGFFAWQSKYFPMDSYKGATLPQCKQIKNVVDPAGLDLQSTVAQQNH